MSGGWRSNGKKVKAWADEVFMLIPVDRWVQIADIMAETDLQDYQVREGVAYIRENFADLGNALISGQNGYMFTLDDNEVIAFRARRIKTAITLLRRTHRSVKPYLDTVLAPSEARFISRQFQRLLEDLADMS